MIDKETEVSREEGLPPTDSKLSSEALESTKPEEGGKKKKKPKPPPPFILKLCEKFPNVFSLTEKKPLKVGISEDILSQLGDDPSVDQETVNKAMRWYVKGHHYLKKLAKGKDRFDLEGNPCGQVTESERKWASVQVQNKKFPLPQKKPVKEVASEGAGSQAIEAVGGETE